MIHVSKTMNRGKLGKAEAVRDGNDQFVLMMKARTSDQKPRLNVVISLAKSEDIAEDINERDEVMN